MPAILEAVNGRFRPHHGKMIRYCLQHIEFLEGQIRALESDIESLVTPFEEEVALLCSIPGIEEAGAAEILAEIGADMGRFPSDATLPPG